MSVLAVRSLFEVLVSLGTNIFIVVLAWGFLIFLLVEWLKGSFRLLNFLQIWFFQKKKRASLKMEGKDHGLTWLVWVAVTGYLIMWIYGEITSK